MARRLWALLLAACVLAEDGPEDRRSKLPYIADAVGNKIPPPSGGPAPVGSPSNLLTPDRYEFYTFDESGELVKRLMTLEEIQAIVAAGEGNEGHMVTFANDDQPNIAFNFSQAPFTKVHNVVTNVQNVLKAQMEAQKNNPPKLTTLDTPDVSDSWSLILPTIFGNTGEDITPEKTSNMHAVPETDTLEMEQSNDENSLGKEGENNLISSSIATSKYESFELSTEKSQASSETHFSPSTTTRAESTTTTPTTTSKSRTTSTTQKPKTTSTTITAAPTVTTSIKPRTTSTTTTAAPKTSTTKSRTTTTTSTTTTSKPRITGSTTTTNKPRATSTVTNTKRVTSTTTTAKPRTTSPITATTNTIAEKLTTTTLSKPLDISSSTTPKSTTVTVKKTPSHATFSTTSKPRINTTTKPIPLSTMALKSTTWKSTTNKFTILTPSEPDKFDRIDTFDPATAKRPSSTEKITTKEELSSYVPVSTVAYVTSERSTLQSSQPSKTTIAFASTTKRSVTSNRVSVTQLSSTESTPIITTYKPVHNIQSGITLASLGAERNENTTTVTTQSVSPSTVMSSTEIISSEKESNPIILDLPSSINDMQENEPPIPIFDIAQSISQITSDLGNNYPITSNGNVVDTSKTEGMDLESKENMELDIPTESNITDSKSEGQVVMKDTLDNFVKISTIDPLISTIRETDSSVNSSNSMEDNVKKDESKKEKVDIEENVTTEATVNAGTIDPILSESMGDLLSQIVNLDPQNIVEHSEPHIKDIIKSTTASTTFTSETTKEDNLSIDQAENIDTSSKFVIVGKIETGSTKQYNKTEVITSNKVLSELKNDNKIISSGLKEPVNRTTETSTVIGSTPLDSEPIREPIKLNQNLGGNDFSNEKVTNNQSKVSAEKINAPSKETETPQIPIQHISSSAEKRREPNKPEKQNPSKIEQVQSPVVSIQNQTKFESISKKSTQKPSSVNKVHISDKLEVADDKISDPRPKIDEFKKKIQKVNIDDKELTNNRNSSWKLISTVKPPKANEIPKDKLKGDNNFLTDSEEYNKDIILDVSKENQGLEVTTKDLGNDIAQFTELCNELAFRYWSSMTDNIDKKRSFVLSPYSVTSMLAMMFMGARGATSGEMNDILKLDDMVTFNPHFTLKNISDSVETTPEAGVIVSAFIRELYSDRDKGRILTFYKERAQHFYNGHVEEINFKIISDVVRRRTNLLVKRYSWGRIVEYMKSNSIVMQPPLAAFSANVFQTDCTGSSVEGRDGEMYFVVSPTVRQRRLVPVPAVVYKKGFLAGYDPVLDATAAALGGTNSIISTLFLMPGQQGNVVHAEDLEALEKRLLDSNPTTPTWNRLLRTLLPRIGLELQIPRFSHKSIFNVSQTLKAMGLKDLFNANHADLGGLNGPSKDLYLSDMVQQTTFVTCGEDVIGEQHHIEEYPESLEVTRKRRTSRWANGWDEPRDYQRAFHDPHDVGEAMHLPLHLRPRQARLPARDAQPARLKFDRPFLYFVRHNPSGMILYVGRYNPRLLP